MERRHWMAIAVVAAIQGAPAAADVIRNGKQVVDQVCGGCHIEGLHGAPRIGDRAAWLTRARNGIDNLVTSAIRGHGEMPARGGMAGLLDVEMRAAVNHMVQESVSGGMPMSVSRLGTLPVRTGKDVVMWRCASCHEAGVGGAPRIADTAAWAPRIKDGLDAMVRSAIRGHDNMPARGGMADLTDEEMYSASTYLTGRYTVGR